MKDKENYNERDEYNMNSDIIIAMPVRIIPFDLGRSLRENDYNEIKKVFDAKYQERDFSVRQKTILKKCALLYSINRKMDCYIYENGICVVAIKEDALEYQKDCFEFAIPYGQNRKTAHELLFHWKHIESSLMKEVVSELKKIVSNNLGKNRLRKSAASNFENKGLSYVMTLSIFDISKIEIKGNEWKKYPKWLQNNIYGLLYPATLYLEDSSVFKVEDSREYKREEILNEIEYVEEVKDYEMHRHLNTYMSWASVTLIGRITEDDKEEYIALEVQLQSDWFYIYCLGKNIDYVNISKKEYVFALQQYNYDIELIENRIFDFDDSSMPTRVLNIQKGLVETSGLIGNIEQLKRKIKFILEKEQFDIDYKQKRAAQRTELLLFFLAFIEISPTVAAWGNDFSYGLGYILNILILICGIILMSQK